MFEVFRLERFWTLVFGPSPLDRDKCGGGLGRNQSLRGGVTKKKAGQGLSAEEGWGATRMENS